MEKNKTQRSEALFERAKKVSPGGVHSPVRAFKSVGGTPRFIQSAKGARLKDVDGNTYLDFCLAWGPLILGHQDEDVASAVHAALNDGWSYGTAEPYSLELAEFLVERLPFIDQVRFVNSGTEAVMSALRLARAYTKRDKILKFDRCYHGHADAMLVRAGSGLLDLGLPDSAGISRPLAKDTLVAPLNDIDAVRSIFEKHGSEIAAMIIEPLPANNSLLFLEKRFLEEITRLARSVGALVIFDEVISGFRVGFQGMSGLLGIEPDLVTYGKIIGGGFPVGAYAGSEKIMNLIAPNGPVYQAGTLSANPIAMRAGLATLKKLAHDDPYVVLDASTQFLADGLEKTYALLLPKLAAKYSEKLLDEPLEVRQFHSIFALQFSSDEELQKKMYTLIFHKLLEKGCYLAPSPFEVGFICTQHTKVDLDFFIEKFDESLRELL